MRSVTFTDLISVSHREGAIRKRAKPSSYNLKSEQHIEYVQTKKLSSQKSYSKKPAKQAKQPKGGKKAGKEKQITLLA